MLSLSNSGKSSGEPEIRPRHRRIGKPPRRKWSHRGRHRLGWGSNLTVEGLTKLLKSSPMYGWCVDERGNYYRRFKFTLYSGPNNLEPSRPAYLTVMPEGGLISIPALVTEP